MLHYPTIPISQRTYKMNSNKRVCIIGAGLSGLLACKHVLSKGFTPTVFEASNNVGGIWVRTFSITHLQTPRYTYQFSDFPWDPKVTSMFPTHDEVLDYLESYAKHFDLYKCISFGCKVVGIEYVGVDEADAMKWDEWAENGEAFGDGNGVWRVSVQRGEDDIIEVHEMDFVIMCIGRFSGFPNIPSFPSNAGPDVFNGKAIHSLDYSDMGSEHAHELIKGKRVTVVGCMKSGLDIASQCAAANGVDKPCTLICRTTRWIIPNFSAWGIPISYLFYNRFSELFYHKPGEGFLLWLLAILLTPLGWMISKFVESYYKWLTPMKKYGMVPDHNFTKAFSNCAVAKLPDKFYDRVGEGSIVIKKAKKFGFCKDGVVLDGDTSPIESDVVIFATGFKGDKKLINIFSSHYFQEIVASTPTTTIPLYRDCVFPRIPQLAVIGFSGSLANLYTFEVRSMWVAHFLDGGFRLPSIKNMEENVIERLKYGCVGASNIWYNDLLCKDMGVNPKRKKGFLANWFQPYMTDDYAGI